MEVMVAADIMQPIAQGVRWRAGRGHPARTRISPFARRSARGGASSG
jgi:hypothetical protein